MGMFAHFMKILCGMLKTTKLYSCKKFLNKGKVVLTKEYTWVSRKNVLKSKLMYTVILALHLKTGSRYLGVNSSDR